MSTIFFIMFRKINPFSFGILVWILYNIDVRQAKLKHNTAMKREHYFSVLIQDSEEIRNIDALREQLEDETGEHICEYLASMVECCSESADNFTEYVPYIGSFGDFVIDTYKGYTLLRNLSLCGSYLIYRKATEEENEWFDTH